MSMGSEKIAELLGNGVLVVSLDIWWQSNMSSIIYDEYDEVWYHEMW